MEKFKIKLADHNISIRALYSFVREMCSSYLTSSPADFSVEITPADIVYEREKSAHEDELFEVPIRYFSDEYLETLAVYRKIAEKMIDYDILLFHGSSVAVDGIGYLFAAKSGTGKSTHTRLWREHFGNRAVMVNDDKPLLKIREKGVTVYGTPWDGKHRLSNNISVPLQAICFLERGMKNEIDEISKKEALVMLMQQSYRPADPVRLAKMMELVDMLGEGVRLYRLCCNMEPEAVQIAYNRMNERRNVR